MSGQIGFWDVQDRLLQLSRDGDPLEKLSVTVNFEMFRADLGNAVPRGDHSRGGRPPLDPVLKFKMLVLQALPGANRVSRERPIELDSVLRARSRRCGPGRQHPVGFP